MQFEEKQSKMIPQLNVMHRLHRYTSSYLFHLKRAQSIGKMVQNHQLEQPSWQGPLVIQPRNLRSSTLSRQNNRTFSSQSYHGNNLRQLDHEDGSVVYEPVNSAPRSWKISQRVTRQFRKLLASEPKYSSTLHLPKSRLSAVTESECNMGIEERKDYINKLCKDGEIRQAMGIVHDTFLSYSSPRQEILMPLEKLLAGHCVQMLSLSDTLYALDAFIQMDFYQPRYLLKTLLDHLTIHFESTKKTPANVVHLLFFIGLSREAPTDLMHAIEMYVEDNVKEYNIVDISLICFGFFVTKCVLQSPTLIQAMANIVLEEIRGSIQEGSQNRLNVFPIGSILKAFRHTGYDDVRFYEELGDLMCETDMIASKNRVPLSVIAHTYLQIPHTYARFRIKHQRLFHKIEECIDHLSYNGLKLRSKDLTRLCWAYAMLQNTAPKHWQEALIGKLIENPYLGEKFKDSYVEALRALAMCGTYPYELYTRLFQSQKYVFEVEDMDTLTINRYRHRLESLARILKVQCPDYAGPTLSKERLEESTQKYFCRRLNTELHHRVGLASLWYTLQHILGENAVTLTFIMDLYAVTDIVIEVDESGHVVSKDRWEMYSEYGVMSSIEVAQLLQRHCDTFRENHEDKPRVIAGASETRIMELEKVHFIPTISIKPRKICIKIVAKNQCIRNEAQLIGHAHMEINLLLKLGYEVYLISPSEANKLDKMTNPERREYVINTLLNPLNIKLQETDLPK